jgi:hypothetical protein
MKVTMIILAMLITSLLNAETIYLRNGDIKRGKITQQDDKSILIESDSKWERIKLSEIEEIHKDDIDIKSPIIGHTPDLVTMPCTSNVQSGVSANKKIEFIAKVGYAFNGKQEINNTYTFEYGHYADGSISESFDTSSSLLLNVESLFFLNDNFCLGGGIEYQTPRKLNDIEGSYSFMPFYLLTKLRTSPHNNTYYYFLGRYGLSNISADATYKGRSSQLTNGTHYAYGAGAAFDKFVIEILYQVNTGKLRNDTSGGYPGNYYSYISRMNIQDSIMTIYFGYRLF